MTGKITPKPQNTHEQQQVLKNVDDKLAELQALEIEITTEKNLDARIAEFALRLKKEGQPIRDLAGALKGVGKAGSKDFTACEDCYKRMWTKINKAIDPIAAELQQTASRFLKDPKTAAQPLERILQQIENYRTPVSTYLDTGATSTDLIVAKEMLDAYELTLFEKAPVKEQPKPIVKDQPKPQPKPPVKEEVRPPIPDVVDQLLPGGPEEVQPGGDEIDWMLDDALVHAGLTFEPVKLPSPSSSSATLAPSTAPALISSSSSSTTSTTTTSDLVLKPHTTGAPEKQFSATRRNTNPLAGQQICMLFISEFARFFKDPSLMNLESIIQDGIQIYPKDKNAIPESLHSLKSPACVFEPTIASYLKLFNGLETERKAGAYRMIGAVLNFEGSSIAIVISLKNNEQQFHIFCPDGNVKLMKKADAFRKEYAQVNEAAAFLVELHKGMKDAPTNGSLLSFVRNQDFMLGNRMKKNGSDSSSASSSSSTVVSTTTPASSATTKTTPASLPLTGLPAHWHDERRLKTLQTKAFSDKPAALLGAFIELKLLTTKTGKAQTSIGSLVLCHLFYIQRQEKDPNIGKPNYSMASAFQCINDFTSTPKQRFAAFIHARADVLMDGLEAAYKAGDLKSAQQYVLSIGELCKESQEDPCNEQLHLLEAISTWVESPATPKEGLDRILYIADARKSLQQGWGMIK
jgi:hypothetical protein